MNLTREQLVEISNSDPSFFIAYLRQSTKVFNVEMIERMLEYARENAKKELVPHWVYGKASSGINQVPVCSKCGWAVNFGHEEHEQTCWAE